MYQMFVYVVVLHLEFGDKTFNGNSFNAQDVHL